MIGNILSKKVYLILNKLIFKNNVNNSPLKKKKTNKVSKTFGQMKNFFFTERKILKLTMKLTARNFFWEWGGRRSLRMILNRILEAATLEWKSELWNSTKVLWCAAWNVFLMESIFKFSCSDCRRRTQGGRSESASRSLTCTHTQDAGWH